ncbi:Aldehyde/histidinol dehydrogenase, partial [Chytriomyces sp. MP71]
PACVSADCDPKYAAEILVDGAFYNNGQSCCGFERIYVHESIYDAFIAHGAATSTEYRLGDPLHPRPSRVPA